MEAWAPLLATNAARIAVVVTRRKVTATRVDPDIRHMTLAPRGRHVSPRLFLAYQPSQEPPRRCEPTRATVSIRLAQCRAMGRPRSGRRTRAVRGQGHKLIPPRATSAHGDT